MSKAEQKQWWVDVGDKHATVHEVGSNKLIASVRIGNAAGYDHGLAHDARLIAAAPDLLANLKEYVAHDACNGEERGHDKSCAYCRALAAIERVEKS